MTDPGAERRSSELNYVAQALEFFALMGPAEAIVHGNRRYSYAETRAAVLAMATALRAHQVHGGMTVVAMTGNHPESLILHLALHLLGCRTGFVAGQAPRRDQLGFIEQAAADVLIHDSGVADDLIGGALAHVPRPVLSLGAEEGRPDLLTEMVLAAAGIQADGEAALSAGARVGHEPQSLFYAGHAARQPRLVLHRQPFYQALFRRGQSYRASGEPAVRHLAIQNLAATSVLIPVLLALFQGGTAILAARPTPGRLAAIIERERVTSTTLSPLRLPDLLAEPALARADWSSLRYLNCGATTGPPVGLMQAIERFGPVVRIVYGRTEMPLITDYPFLVGDPAHPERLRSCGTPSGDARVEVRDVRGAVLPPGETGEIWATGSLVMAGYAGQPELTSRALVDGWLRTGDTGYTDPDGFLYLVDRSGAGERGR